MLQEINWKLSRELVPPAKPREINYDPTSFRPTTTQGTSRDFISFQEISFTRGLPIQQTRA